MGTWGTNIKDNDTTMEIIEAFFELYNEGKEPSNISAMLIKENKGLINIPEASNNFWFALALAQWETKSLDIKIFEKVKLLIESGNDLEVWKSLEADDKTIAKRKIALEKFLVKLQTEKVKAKLREKPRNVKPIFGNGDCLTFKFDNGNYGGVVILATVDDPKSGLNLVVCTRINKRTKPTINDFEKAELLIKNFAYWEDRTEAAWIFPDKYQKKYSNFYELIGRIKVEKEYTTSSNVCTQYHDEWNFIKASAQEQFEYEKSNPKPKKVKTIAEVTKN
jgi:hypothetical protein